MSDFQIFISYRRDGGEDLAGRLSDKLTGLGYKVFYDIESMRSGTFNTQIFSAIDQCEDILLILPPNGLDRCADENDWVRLEIEYSMQKNKNIIPLMMRNFVFPETLPESIDQIRYFEAVEASTVYFDAVVTRIESLLKSSRSQADGVEDPEIQILKDGIRLLNRKMFSQALICFEKVIQNDISTPDAYFYAAIAMLEGKRPFLSSKASISKIENYISSAIAFSENAVYYYFYAYVLYDFYSKKMLKAPLDYKQLLLTSAELGITDSEINALFDILNTQKPEVF